MKFERMTKTFKFVTDRSLETVEQVEDYKAKSYDTIELLKDDQLKSKAVSRKKGKLYKALTAVRKLKKPYQLYLDGYTGMQKEHDNYLSALNTLKSAGYETNEQLNELEKEKSDITEVIARNSNHIRHFRYEIRMCDNALAANEHIEKKMEKLKPQQQQKNIRRETEYEPSKR